MIEEYKLGINFPFEYMKSDEESDLFRVKWIIGDKDQGEDMPLNDLTKIYEQIKEILFYKRGWLGYNAANNYAAEEGSPNILLAELHNGIFMLIYTTTDYTGYDCINNVFEVFYSHNLYNLLKYGANDKIRKRLTGFDMECVY